MNLKNGEDKTQELATYDLDEVKKHTQSNDKWIIINNCIYDVSKWQYKHPGGARIISHFAGQDATDAWTAMHIDKQKVEKYMKPLLIGKISKNCNVTHKNELETDFRSLRKQAEDAGLFHSNPAFFALHFFHIVILEILAFSVMYYFGTGWFAYMTVALILTTSQAQAGWSQHDYGHLSVCSTSKLNHLMHEVVIGHLKGASSHWWNFRHFQHHTKPNVLRKDPDVNIAYLFLLGRKLPVQWGKNKRGFMPYQWQHDYFFILGPPVLLPIYFHFENLYFVFKRRDWWVSEYSLNYNYIERDLFWISTFFLRFFYTYSQFLGAYGAFTLYMTARFFESFWFVFVTQMNHIPMDIDSERELDWASSQLAATCNVESSFFNDWFTGHLNFQIEHHFFPTMPRHNYHKIAPSVKNFCEKHKLPYICKPLGTAFADIIRSLRHSGQLWYQAYYDL